MRPCPARGRARQQPGRLRSRENRTKFLKKVSATDGRGLNTDCPLNRPAATFSPNGGEGWDEGDIAQDTDYAKWCGGKQSQRDCSIQPRVGAQRLPWVDEQNDFNPERVECGDGGGDATLSGLGLLGTVP